MVVETLLIYYAILFLDSRPIIINLQVTPLLLYNIFNYILLPILYMIIMIMILVI